MLETQTHTDTARVLAAMLRENTGVAICDSGGTPKYDEQGRYLGSDYGYGRHYEQNQNRDFDAEPATVVSFKYGIEVTHSVYHWLLERVEYAPDVQDLFEQFRDETDPDDDKYRLDLMEEFPEWLRERGYTVSGLYGDGDPFTVNTYNGEDLLSQVLQYRYFELDGDPYVLLQIHGGCDVRGGYTAPKAFQVLDDGVYLWCNADGHIYCNPRTVDSPGQLGLDGKPVPLPELHYWRTDDGYHWYDEGCAGCGAGTQLEQYERKDIGTPDQWEPGSLCIDEQGDGYCPKCAGKLEASF